MNRKKKLLPLLRSILKWPVYLMALLVFMNIYMYVIDIKAGVVATIFIIIYAAAFTVFYVIKRKRLVNELVTFAVNYGTIQRRLSSELELPYVLIDMECSILWANKIFISLVGD